MAEPRKKNKKKPIASKKKPELRYSRASYIKFLIPIFAITFLLFLRALQNGFTNWDDVLYVTENPLLKDLSFKGIKAILSTPVVSNYHPITILSLALNYQLAGLSPWSYHLTSIFLHLINTGLVFWFILFLADRNKWIAGSVALLFAIHPMHVESVAWISERKDLLYTLFYLLALIIYIKYLQSKKINQLILVTVSGGLSLLCKPAAIVLPFSLLLLDYYFKRPWSVKWIAEKIPLFLMSAVIAVITLRTQSDRAIASVELYNVLERICFAGFGLTWYLVKLIFPLPLSTLHPFPKDLSIWYYLGTLTSLTGLLFLAIKVRSRIYLFAFGFYVVNLILVLQLISIGNAVVSERYTYVPYISIFFLLASEIYSALKSRWVKWRTPILMVAGIWILFLITLSWMRIPVWKSSETLWTDVLKHYPENPRAWTNKALIYFDRKEWQKTIDDLSNALKYDPQYADALEWRARTYLEKGEGEKAMADAIAFQNQRPQNHTALFLKARAFDAVGRDQDALNAYNELISLEPNVPEYINNRGVIYFNKLKNYEAAKKDFERCISINGANGMYFLNLSRCYYMMGDQELARENLVKALKLGTTVDLDYQKLLGLD
jgi:Tfp pilus assembly protein PilF